VEIVDSVFPEEEGKTVKKIKLMKIKWRNLKCVGYGFQKH